MFVILRHEGKGMEGILIVLSHVCKFISREEKVIAFLQNPLFVSFFKRGREEIRGKLILVLTQSFPSKSSDLEGWDGMRKVHSNEFHNTKTNLKK